MKLRVREMQLNDITKIVDYFRNADTNFLEGMGVDKNKLPEKDDWIEKLKLEFNKSYKQKEFYYIIWLIDNHPLGHSNINNIEFGDTALMHLHLWKKGRRKSGLGLEFLKQTIPFYFKHFELKKLICKPYAENIAPNKTLKKIGFEMIRTYNTIPGWINFHQTVNQYELTKEQFHIIINTA